MLSIFRSLQNPFISPTRTRAFEAIGAFNPSVICHEGEHHVFYRAMAEPDDLRTPGRGFSTIGYAHSTDGLDFTNRKQIISAEESWEGYGCEDARATFFEGKWYVFYTALGGFPFNASNIKVAVAIGTSPNELNEKHLVTPFNAKAATLFPERIQGDAVMIVTAHTDWTEDHRQPVIGIARSKNIEDFWNEDFWNDWHAHIDEHVFPDVRRSDSEHMEVGATPILTDAGWLLIYSHIQNYYDEHNRIFGIEAVLLDRNDPRVIISKTQFPFLVPEESYERYGLVANIVFPSSAQLSGDTLTVYYGAADTVCAMVKLSLADLLSSMSGTERDTFVHRESNEPILAPIPEHAWESAGVFNAAAVDIGGSVHLLYRATDPGNYSKLGYARLEDGIHVDERLPEPVYIPREPFEVHGTEDPRLSLLGDTLHMAYTAYDGSIARGALASISAKDFVARKFEKWTKPIAITPAGVNDKDLCIIPGLVKDKVVIMHRIDPNICVESFDAITPDLVIDRCTEIMTPRPGMWDAQKIGASAPPIRVEEGWLFIYHAVGNDFVYRLGAALLDAETASIVLARTAAPIFSPVLEWEREGTIKNVIFSCGIVLREDTLFIYYGGADTAIGVATLSKEKLMKRLLPKID
jgi:predicted GH43/DUF377 family glycosyl hydrolase